MRYHKAISIEKKIICLLEKDKRFFVFLSNNDNIVNIEETTNFKSAEQYYQNLVKRYKINGKGVRELRI